MADTFAIVDVSDMDASKWADCAPVLEATARSAGDLRIIRWPGSDPSWVATLGLTTYDALEMITEIIAQDAATPGTWEEE